MNGKDLMAERDSQKRAASPGGSLGALMDQGGSYSHASDDTLPQLMNQGGSDKRGSKTHVPARTLLGQ
jgi:hypothetical protein